RDRNVTGVQTCALPIFQRKTTIKNHLTLLFHLIFPISQRFSINYALVVVVDEFAPLPYHITLLILFVDHILKMDTSLGRHMMDNQLFLWIVPPFQTPDFARHQMR